MSCILKHFIVFIIHYFLAHLYVSARRAAALTLASAVPVAFGISKMLQLKWRLAIGMKVFLGDGQGAVR